ncbi:branched-chain amino acid ABC transporter permease [Deferribacterales bacterium RsTz2092]|nr:branched-chain amino acid ABC transporter permease [Deferribacterales bacterium]
MSTFLQQLFNGLTIGSIYGFIALGYTMVYGTLKLINFAHGDMVTLAAFLAITLSPLAVSYGTLGVLLVMLIVITLTCGVAILLEYFAYRPLRAAPRLSLIVSALGAGLIIQNAVMLIWGANVKVFPELFPNGMISIAGASITYLGLFILILNALIMFALSMFINKTRMGIAIRALSIDYGTAELMGVNINRTIAIVFALGGALGAVGGILIGASYTSVSFAMGFDYGIKAFVAAILGGIGSIAGAMLGGLILGLIYAFSAGYISSIWADTFTYLILIALIIFKPNGLFGQAAVQKV